MRDLPLRMMIACVVALLALGSLGPAGAAPSPMQAPTEAEMAASMEIAADWMMGVVGADGQMSLPFGSPPWEAESGGRLSMNGLALLRAYQTTGDQAYLDRAKVAGDLVASSIDAGSKYVIDRTGILPTEAYGGFPNAQAGKVDDAYLGTYTGTVTFKTWESAQALWFLGALYKETGMASYANALLLVDRLVALQMYSGDDMSGGLHGAVALSASGTWTPSGKATMTDLGTLLLAITRGGEDLINLWRDRYTLVSHIRPQQGSDGSFPDGFDLPGQDSQKETKHAIMIPALYDIGIPREADKLVQWVVGQRQADGRYACPHDKDPYGDTAAAALGLLPVGQVSDGGEAVNWLLGSQKGDGSWDAQPGLDIEVSKMLSTHWAMMAVAAGLSNYNLRIDGSMVTADPIWEGDPAKVMGYTVNVTVENQGLVSVVGAVVKVFDGPKGGGNQPLDASTIDVPSLGTSGTSLEFRPGERGPHYIHVWVEYAPGGEWRTRDNNLSVWVNLNREPTGSIALPNQGQLFGFGAVIEFQAADLVDLDEDPINLTWVDDVTGLLSHEAHFYEVLPPGEHTVTLTFADGNGPPTRANVSFSVRENIAPTIRISTPANDARYYDYQTITFDASASSDAENHYLHFTWVSDVAGVLGQGSVVKRRLEAGPHLITVHVDDTWDNVSKSVHIRVIRTFPPDIVIDSPMDGETYVTTTRVEFDASATTDPDSEILEFFWYSNIDGLLSERDSFLAKLSVGKHHITLAVDDGNYNVTRTVVIDVLENRAPVSMISSPEDGTSFGSDVIVELNGSGSYDLEDPITYFWVSSRSGPLGAKPVLELQLPRGEHIITLWVDDDHGHNVSSSVEITILNLGPSAGISSPEVGGIFMTGRTVFFNSDTSTDPEGDRLTFEWYLRRTGGEWIGIGTNARVQRDIDTPGEYEVRLVVSDGKLTDEATSTFNVERAADGGGDDDGGLLGNSMLLVVILVVVIAVVAVAAFLLRSRD